jgi:hypothetical protein
VQQYGLESTGSELVVVAGPCERDNAWVAVIAKFRTLKVKVNFTLDQATKAQTGSKSYSSTL